MKRSRSRKPPSPLLRPGLDRPSRISLDLVHLDKLSMLIDETVQEGAVKAEPSPKPEVKTP
ncbi:MAG: uncharacterized protein KVP18_003582 [Porospora cf. gigantea A]|uniref:uncharacterized protein n=1 Tax=Porospora cf. gigantea A TaxID=2853593 RepID=UPI00355A659C|nr:MAG: hypothetical protein KVP18_003582 [Porospora cf. gigantea A]